MANALAEQLKDLVISRDRIILHKEYVLGRGGYGYVCYANLEHTRKDGNSWEPVAAKMMITEGSIPEYAKKELLKEACKLREVTQNDNIVRLLGVLMEIDNYGLILELMVFGNVVAFIKDYGVVWPQNKLPIQLCQQVASAMAYLHSFDPPMLHMDLKGDNVLINHNFNAKICDFGIAEWKTKTTRPAESRRGTLSHIAPEILLDVNIKSTAAQDVYSFAICTWEIFTGRRPFLDKSEDLVRICVKDGQRPDMKDIGERCPDYIVDMMKLCWNQDPTRRPDFNSLNTQLSAMCKKMKREIFLGKKAVRRKICEKHLRVNDPKRMMTDHWDDLTESLNDTDEILCDAEPISEPVPQGDTTGITVQDDVSEVGKADNVPEGTLHKETAPLPGKQYKFNLPKKDLTPFDIKVREILRDPLLMEMIVSGNADHLDLPPGVKDLLSNPALLQKYIDEDTSFKLELKRMGHSVYDSIQCPKIKDAKHKGGIDQHEARGTEPFRFSVYEEEKRGYEKNARDKKQDARTQSMLTSPYFGRLYKSPLYDKVMKALSEPHQVQEAFADLEKGTGEVEMFSVIGHDVLEVLQDPVMLNILLKNDKETMDNFMRSYSDLTMKLLARNKTNYVPGSKSNRRRRDPRDPDFPFSRRRRDPFDRDRFGRDPFDSDSDDDDEMSDLMRMAFRHRGRGPEGDMDRRMMEMLIRGKEERRKRMDEDYRRHQEAVRKNKKQEPSKPIIKTEPKSPESAVKMEPKSDTKTEPKPIKTDTKMEPNPQQPVHKIEPKPSESVPKMEPNVPKLEVDNKRTNDVAVIASASSAKEIKLEQLKPAASKVAENDKDAAETGSSSDASNMRDEKKTAQDKVSDSQKPGEAVTPEKQKPLSLEASMDEMSIDDTADGVILYSDADRNTVDNKMGVTKAITVIKNLLQTRVPNLQLRLLDELPISGLSEFDFISYILKHFNYIFIYITQNFTPDTLRRFQSQMCLCDTIQNNNWRVIPIIRDQDITNIPLELQVLKSVKMWNLQDPDKKIQSMFIESFAKTLQDGREKNYATRYPSLGLHKNQNATEEDAELSSDEESMNDKGKLPTKASPGMHTMTHKHSGGGLTTIKFTPGGNIPNLQVGNKNIMVIGPSGEVQKSKIKSKKSKENVKLTESEEPITSGNMDEVCSEIGQEWRRLCRKMGFSDGECEQFRQDFHVSGTYEITYQAMRRWIQKRPGEAIKKNLAAMLHELDRDDLATKI